jgi:hypothetical protein
LCIFNTIIILLNEYSRTNGKQHVATMPWRYEWLVLKPMNEHIEMF